MKLKHFQRCILLHCCRFCKADIIKEKSSVSLNRARPIELSCQRKEEVILPVAGGAADSEQGTHQTFHLTNNCQGSSAFLLQARSDSGIYYSHFWAAQLFTIYVSFLFHFNGCSPSVWDVSYVNTSLQLLPAEGQSLSLLNTSFASLLFIISSLIVHDSKTCVGAGGDFGGCDGNWGAEPQSLPCSAGRQGGPTLPQHPARLAIQADRPEQGPQRIRRGQMNFTTEIWTQLYSNQLVNWSKYKMKLNPKFWLWFTSLSGCGRLWKKV